jgi:hypothetical protein
MQHVCVTDSSLTPSTDEQPTSGQACGLNAPARQRFEVAQKRADPWLRGASTMRRPGLQRVRASLVVGALLWLMTGVSQRCFVEASGRGA